MTVINTNLLSQIAQNNLNATQSSLTQAITELSSGKKINSAADDPAGLAIVGRLTAQINGQTTAQANANGGISLAQTGQSALSQITNNLQTIRQLAVQASNATYSAADRASLNQEVQQSLAQINTIAATTSFNGQSLLDGTFGTQNFQIGANAGQIISVNLSQGAKASQIGQTYSSTLSLAGTAGLSNQALSVSVGGAPAVAIGTAVADVGAGQTANSAYAAAQAINNANVANLTATATNQQSFNISTVTNTGTAAANYNLQINGIGVFTSATGQSLAVGGTIQSGDLVNAINSVTSKTGVTAALNADGSVNLTATDGRNITVNQTGDASVSGGLDNTAYTYNGAAGTLSATAYGGTANGSTTGALQGTVSLSSSGSITLSGAAAASLSQANAANGASATANLTAGTGSYAGNAVAAGTFATPFALGANDLVINGVSVTTSGAGTVTSESDVAGLINNNAALAAQGIKATVTNNGQGLTVSSSTSAVAISGAKANAIFGVTTGASSYSGAAPSDATNGLANLTNLTAGQLSVNGVSLTGDGSSISKIAGLVNANATLAQQGITASVSSGALVITNASGTPVSLTGTQAANVSGTASALDITAGTYTSVDTSLVQINGIAINGGTTTTKAGFVAAINANTTLAQAGITASLNANTGDVELFNANGGAIDLNKGASTLAPTATFYQSNVASKSTSTIGATTAFDPTSTLTVNGVQVNLSTASGGTVGALSQSIADLINKNATLKAAGITADGSSANLTIYNANGGAVYAVAAGTNSADFGAFAATAATTPESSNFAATATTYSGTLAAGDFAVNGVQVTGVIGAGTNVADLANAINKNSALAAAGITADGSGAALKIYNASGGSITVTGNQKATITGTGTFTGPTDAASFTGAAPTAALPTSLAAGQLSINGYSVTATSITSLTDVATAINNANITGISASVSGGALVLKSGDDTSIKIGGTAANTLFGTSTATTNANYSVGSGGSLQQIDVLSTADAQKAIQTVDAALNQISVMQGQLGAVQNRFSSTISNLTASTQNAQSTQSTTQDTDYAAAAAQLSRAQVLSQAATAMIAQANQLPQQVLKLLQ